MDDEYLHYKEAIDKELDKVIERIVHEPGPIPDYGKILAAEKERTEATYEWACDFMKRQLKGIIKPKHILVTCGEVKLSS